jgi:hypothetical protein
MIILESEDAANQAADRAREMTQNIEAVKLEGVEVREVVAHAEIERSARLIVHTPTRLGTCRMSPQTRTRNATNGLSGMGSRACVRRAVPDSTFISPTDWSINRLSGGRASPRTPGALAAARYGCQDSPLPPGVALFEARLARFEALSRSSSRRPCGASGSSRPCGVRAYGSSSRRQTMTPGRPGVSSERRVERAAAKTRALFGGLPAAQVEHRALHLESPPYNPADPDCDSTRRL